MKKSARVLFFILLGVSLYGQQNNVVSIVPKPVNLQLTDGTFLFNEKTPIVIGEREELSKLGDLFAETINSITGWKLKPVIKPASEGNNGLVAIEFDPNIKNEEGYLLSVKPDIIKISAQNGAGIFYAVQTLSQLLKYDNSVLSVPCVEIEDYPRFKWRGMHLDVCRHFFPVEFVKKYIDILASYKLNTFHWHLTEDQGWRIEIKKYPKLTEIASMRKETMGDGKPYGGYYTQNQIKEVVEYAKQKYVNIVPEIEMPGHALAALTAYPEYSCTGGPFDVGTIWGVYDDVYCAGNDNTFKFLEDVLDEVIALFPYEYIHIGGDEVPKTRWEKCGKCQARMKAEGLKDEHELQSYFVQRIEKYLNSKGKKIIGWDEILEGGLAPNAAVMSWRGIDGGIAAAKQKHNAVMSPGGYCYFDHYQGLSGEPKAFGGYTPLEKVYSYEPVPEALNDDEKKFIIGAQANMWTEHIETSGHVEYMLLPRLCALSEVLWSPKDERNLADFLLRMPHQYDLLIKKGYNFRVPPPIEAAGEYLITENEKITLSSALHNSEIYYTLDGSEPDRNSKLYTNPLSFSENVLLKAKTFLADGQSSPTSSLQISMIDTTANGLYYKYYEGEWTELPSFNQLKPKRIGIVNKLSIDQLKHSEDYFGIFFFGFIQIDDGGDYTFYLTSDDGSELALNNQILINNDGLHGSQTKSNNINLEEGRFPIKILYFENSGSQGLKLEYEGPGIPRRPVPASKLFFDIR